MQEIQGLAELIRIWIDGGSWADIKAAHAFQTLVALAAWLVPSSLIALGIGLTQWRETPLARWFGVDPRDRDEGWAERARDIDKDGAPDF